MGLIVLVNIDIKETLLQDALGGMCYTHVVLCRVPVRDDVIRTEEKIGVVEQFLRERIPGGSSAKG